MDNPVAWFFLVVSEIVAIGCIVHLWRGNDLTRTKLFWSVVSVVPFLGPLLYGGLHDPPSILPPDARAKETRDARFYRGPTPPSG